MVISVLLYYKISTGPILNLGYNTRGSENSERYAEHSDRQAKSLTGPAEIKLDRKKFGKQIVLKFMRQICLKCVNDLKNEFLVKFYSDLIGFALLWVKQNPRIEPKSILGFLELYRTFGPAKLVPGSDLRSLCPTGPAGPTVSEPLRVLSISFLSLPVLMHCGLLRRLLSVRPSVCLGL